VDKFRYGLIIASFWVFNVQPVAAESKHNSSVWMQYSEDENHLKDTLLEMNLALDADTTLILHAGETDLPLFPKIPLLSRIVTTHEYYIGLNTLSNLPWSLDVGLSYWGKDSEMVTHTLHFNPNWNAEDWLLGFNFEFSDIDLYTVVLPSGQYRIETESIGAGPIAQFYIDDFSLGFFAMWYDYSEDPSRLSNLSALILGNTRVHAGTLYDWYAGLSIQYTLGNVNTAISYQHSVLAIDRSASDDIAMSFGFGLSRDLQIELELGRTFQDNDVTINYGTVRLGFYF